MCQAVFASLRHVPIHAPLSPAFLGLRGVFLDVWVFPRSPLVHTLEELDRQTYEAFQTLYLATFS